LSGHLEPQAKDLGFVSRILRYDHNDIYDLVCDRLLQDGVMDLCKITF